MLKIHSGNWDRYFKGTVTWNSMRNAATRAGVPFKWIPQKEGSYNVHKEYELANVEKTMLYMIKATKHLNNQAMFLPKWQSVLDRVKELEDGLSTSSDN